LAAAHRTDRVGVLGLLRAGPPTVESLAGKEEPLSMNKTELLATSTRIER